MHRSIKPLLASVACAIALNGCAEGERAPAGGVVNAPASEASGPLAGQAKALRNVLAGRVLVAAFTNPLHGEGIAEIVYYRRDGTGYVDRLAAREPTLQTFRWDVRARPPGNGASYVFISGDGREDGAAVTYSHERQRLAFSDAVYGPYFSFGVLQDCWPGFAPARPPEVAVCDASGDATTLHRLESEAQAVGMLRFQAREHASNGLFTTQSGAIYTNSLGNTLTVKEVDDRRVTFTNQVGAEFVSHALLYSYNSRVLGNETVVAAIDSLWPLEVGKTAQAWVYNADWGWELAWKVTRRATITVPAGTFEAWAIEHTETAIGQGYIGKSETWYAPAVGWNVRHRSWIETEPNAPKSEWVLVGATLPGPAPIGSRAER